MNIPDFIAHLSTQDIHIWVQDDKLRINAPKGALTPELRDQLAAHKTEIMAFLQMANSAHVADSNQISRADRSQEIPLSFSQQRLWFLDQFEPGSTAYSILVAIRVEGSLDLAILEKTYNEIVRRHEALRTVFVVGESGQPIQKINPYTWFSVPVHSLEDLPEAQRDDEAHAYIQQQARIPFDLSQGPLYRFEVIRLSPNVHILFYNFHHIVSDGWSTTVFFNELPEIYKAIAFNVPSPLPELPFQYADYAVWQRRSHTPQAFQKQLDFWKQKLAGTLPILELPADHPRPAMQTFNGAVITTILPKRLADRLKALASYHEVTLFVVLLAAFKALLYRYTGQVDLVVGTPVANRHSVDVEKLIGFFVNTLVLRTDVSDNPTFLDLLHRLREGSFEAFAHQELPFEFLVDALHIQRDTSHSPVFQVMFIHQNMPSRYVKVPGWEVKPLVVDPGSAKFDLTVSLGEVNDDLHCTFEYNTDLFNHDTIHRMLGHYQTILDAVCNDVRQRLDDLPLLTEGERQQVLVEWNNTRADYPQLCVQELFAEQAKRTPQATAVQFEGQTITYQELDRRSNQLARHLQMHGVGPEKLVGIHIERSIEMVIALLGVLKAGGAYLPLDPHFPKDRLAYMVEDSQAGVMLTQSHLVTNLATGQAKIFCMDTDWAEIEKCSDAPLVVNYSLDHLAYVLYTSGSTGRPKGVQVLQRGLVNFLHSMQHTPGITPDDVLLSVTTLSFDIAGLELYLPLITGARLVLVSSQTAADGGELAQEMAACGATFMQATPATWRLLIGSGWQGNPRLKILCGGEALPPELADALLTRCGSLWNMYGPTETTIWSTLSQITTTSQPITVGRPIDNTQIYLLDARQQPVPIGVPGELYIGGDGLARGYLNRPELTAEKFVPNPFRSDETPHLSDRLYRTGDLARYRSNGNIEFMGRLDHQVKVRGFRIELGEIEAVLEQHPAIRQAVVLAREDTPGDVRLVAYLTTAAAAPSVSELRAFLQAKLPDYMVPVIYVFLDTLPLTPNGKVDRRALPAPDSARPELSASYIAPRNETERILAAIWQEALRLDQVGINDNFFELGGHSLLMVQVHRKVCQQIKSDITIAQMFQYPTIESLAKYLDRSQSDSPTLSSQKVLDRAALQRESLQRLRKLNTREGNN